MTTSVRVRHREPRWNYTYDGPPHLFAWRLLVRGLEATRFAGYFRDQETQLDYAKNRYHQPGMGRFLTVDGGGVTPTSPGSWNRYAYVRGDPINRKDRHGRDCRDVALNHERNDSQIRSALLLTVMTTDATTRATTEGAAATTVTMADVSHRTRSTLTRSPGLRGPGAIRPDHAADAAAADVLNFPCTRDLQALLGIRGQHTYLDVTETLPSGQVLFNDVLKGDPAHGHSAFKHPRASGNMQGFVEPVSAGQFQGSTNSAKNTLLGSDSGPDGLRRNCVHGLRASIFITAPVELSTHRFRNGTTTFNSNSFTYTLLADIGIAQIFSSVIGWSPGWGFIVPGM